MLDSLDNFKNGNKSILYSHQEFDFPPNIETMKNLKVTIYRKADLKAIRMLKITNLMTIAIS